MFRYLLKMHNNIDICYDTIQVNKVSFIYIFRQSYQCVKYKIQGKLVWFLLSVERMEYVLLMWISKFIDVYGTENILMFRLQLAAINHI